MNRDPRTPLIAMALLSTLLLGACSSGAAPANHTTPSPEASAESSEAARTPAAPSAEVARLLAPQDARTISAPKAASGTLVLFTDYQCPFCAGMDSLVRQANDDYGNDLRIIIRNFPLPIHENAPAAARAVEAAAEQGALEKMSETVFEHQDQWSQSTSVDEQFLAYARDLGLDTEKFLRDYESEAIAERVERDSQDAMELGLQGTPTLILQDTVLAVDVSNYETLSAPLDDFLNR